MIEKIKKTAYRPSGKITDFLIIAFLLSFLVFLLGDFIAILGYRLFDISGHLVRIIQDEDIVSFFQMYLDFWGVWAAFFLVISVFKNNRPMWKCLSFRRSGNSAPAILAGILLGFGTNGFCILMSFLLGDIKLSFNSFDPLLFFSFLLAVLIQSGGEEILDRCYLYQKLRRRYRSPLVAILGNSLFFMGLHLFNNGISILAIVDLFLTGILFSMFVYYYDSLWCAILFHTCWNFSQSIAFGLPNSGLVSKYSLFRLDAASARNGFFYTVDFGVEGSWGSVLIQAAVIAAILLLNRGRGEKEDLWKQMEIESVEAEEARQKAEVRER